jgi:hypothetical protein
MLLGCALFHDLLKPAAILRKVLQNDEVCVLSAIEAVLKTSKNLETVQISRSFPLFKEYSQESKMLILLMSIRELL